MTDANGGSRMDNKSHGTNGVVSYSSKVNHDHVNAHSFADRSLPLSNAALESKAKQLQQESATLSAALTQKLATSQSGQNLLHMGTSLSTLPPDLHLLLQNLHPICSATELTEKSVAGQLEKIVASESVIQKQQARGMAALSAVETYQDLVAAERIVALDAQMPRQTEAGQRMEKDSGSNGSTSTDGPDVDELDHSVALERAATITVSLLEELQLANEVFTTSIAMQQDTEHEQFLVKLAPRIRRLEMDLSKCLGQRMELALNRLPELRRHQTVPVDESNGHDNAVSHARERCIVVLGHVMRALAILGRSKDVESIFARAAMIPLVRSKLSMGRLDEGGSRGECAGLKGLLDDLVQEIADVYSPLLVAAEAMFAVRQSGADVQATMEVDLLTEGVWVPIVSMLMSDAGIKMSIFSPGIASILQANYTALDSFLALLSSRLLHLEDHQQVDASSTPTVTKLYQTPMSLERIQQAQDRIYAHPKTAEFSKKWNLPIYYQLRFGECCSRINKAVDQTKLEGWVANVYTGLESHGEALRQSAGFELSLFIELYDTLLGLWLPNVILRPLTNRFLRGAIQLVGRVVAFINDGMDGKLLFGEEPPVESTDIANADEASGPVPPPPSYPSRKPYCWSDSEENVASVAWELALLESAIRHDYADVVCEALSPRNATNETTASELADIRGILLEVLKEAGDQIFPTIDKAWNQVVVNLLTQKCFGPLAAVKGVAATYRMTNRPPPTQSSPFVATILRPLKEFNTEFSNRIPAQIGSNWKQQIVVSVAERYAAAVDDLITTVQRTEAALQNRRARRTAAGGMSDGEKVKLQLYLDYKSFEQSVREVGIEPASVIGISRLGELTSEGEALMRQRANES